MASVCCQMSVQSTSITSAGELVTVNPPGLGRSYSSDMATDNSSDRDEGSDARPCRSSKLCHESYIIPPLVANPCVIVRKFLDTVRGTR